MPPAIPIATATGTSGGGPLTNQKFVPPALCKPGDIYVAIVAIDNGIAIALDADDSGTDGWIQLATFNMTEASILVAMREAKADDPPTVELILDAATAWAISAMLCYRNLDIASPAVEASASNVVASTNFPCPARNLTHYSDLYLGIVLVTDWTLGTDVAPPGGGAQIERYDSNDGLRELEVFDYYGEGVGSSGLKTATTGTNKTGVAASILLAAVPPLDAATKAIELDPSGTIGLPTVGV